MGELLGSTKLRTAGGLLRTLAPPPPRLQVRRDLVTLSWEALPSVSTELSEVRSRPVAAVTNYPGLGGLKQRKGFNGTAPQSEA